jgi:uncharacterized cupredoxin-like copper-binding protein
MRLLRSIHRLPLATALLVTSALLGACAGNSDHTASLAKPASTSHEASAAASSVTVGLSEFKVALPFTTLTPGTKTLEITNGGTVPHELLVFRSDLDPSAYPMDSGDINEDGPGITKVSDGDNIAPGAKQTRTVDLSQPGRYLFVCNLPGHFHSGMFTSVTVGPVAETASVDLSEFSIGASTTTLHPGTTTFTITNQGKTQHELLVFHSDLAPSAFPLDPDGSVQEDGAGLVKVSDGDNLDPGKGQTRTVDFTQPGTYYLVCNLPGHFKAGMVTKVTVS